MKGQTIVNQFADLSVTLNGLVIPSRSVECALSRHAFNLVAVNDDELYKVSLIGSSTAVRYKDHEILLATQHQIQGFDETRVAMLTDSGNLVITSGGSRKYNSHPETDAYDIVAFDFTEPCREHTELKKRFFNLKEMPPPVMNKEVLAMLLIGYPFADQHYEVHENNHLGLARRLVTCLPKKQPSDEALLSAKAQQPLPVSPDGMSGGSAFVIQMENGLPNAYFAGIIVRGGLESFQILKAGFIISFMKSFLG